MPHLTTAVHVQTSEVFEVKADMPGVEKDNIKVRSNPALGMMP